MQVTELSDNDNDWVFWVFTIVRSFNVKKRSILECFFSTVGTGGLRIFSCVKISNSVF